MVGKLEETVQVESGFKLLEAKESQFIITLPK